MARKYTEEEIQDFKDKIIDELWKGHSLRKVLRKNKELPSRRYIYEWLNPNNDKFDAAFSNQYAHVREDVADDYFEQILEIGRKVKNKEIEPANGRVAIDALKWAASRMKPKKYGDKLDLTTGGKELTQQVTIYELPNNGRDDNATKTQNIVGLDEKGQPIYE